MPHWNYTLNLKDVWSNDELGFEEKRDTIVKRIKAALFYRQEWSLGLEDIVEGLEGSEDITAFDCYFDDFYDFADATRVWVATC
jgi:hypothetical protein